MVGFHIENRHKRIRDHESFRKALGVLCWSHKKKVCAVGKRWAILNDQRRSARGSQNAVSSVVGGWRLFSVFRKAKE